MIRLSAPKAAQFFSGRCLSKPEFTKATHSKRKLAGAILSGELSGEMAAEAWEKGFRAAIKTGRQGWGVSNDKSTGRVRLKLQFPKAGDWPSNSSVNLPYAWTPASINPVIQLVNAAYGPVMEGQVPLKAAIENLLAISDQKADLVRTAWPGIARSFRTKKLSTGNRIADSTYSASYGRYIEVALQHLQGPKSAQTGKALIERVLIHQRTNKKPGKRFGEQLTPWIDQPKSRMQCCLALKLFLEFAVAEHRQAQSFLIIEKDYLQLRGGDGRTRKKAVLTDAQICELIRLLPEHWSNVVKVCRLFGVRPWEINFIERRINPGGEQQLFVRKGKEVTSRSGVKEETEPRWLEAVAIDGTTFGLVEKWESLKLPARVSGANLGARLRRLQYWNCLVEEFKANGEWLRPYSFRDTFSVRAHDLNISSTNIAQAMGHSVEVHHRSYRTSEWKGVRKAFLRAS